MSGARSNPLAQKQPSAPVDLVERQLRDGLGELPAGASVTTALHELEGGKKYTLFVIRAYGAEWTFDTEMSTSAAYQTGQSVAKMITAQAPKGRP